MALSGDNDTGFYGGMPLAQAPNNKELQWAMQQRAQSGLAGAKEASVQERMAHTLDNIMRAHGILDSLANGPSPNKDAIGAPLGLIGSALSCEEQSERLCQRLYSLQSRLGQL